MAVLFRYTEEFRVLSIAVKAILLVISAISLTNWYINLNSRTINRKQRDTLFAFTVIAAFYLNLLFFDLVYPSISYRVTYLIIFTLTLFLANFFLLLVLIPFAEDKLFSSIRRTLMLLSLAIALITLTDPIHKLINPSVSPIDGQLNWLLNIFLYYGVANILIGFFIYFSFSKQTADWSYGIVAIGITSLFVILLGFSIPHLYEWDLFWLLFLGLYYFILIFDLASRILRTPSFLKSLSVFERAEIIMAIYGRDGTIKFLSHGATNHRELIRELDESIIQRADGALHILDKDDTIFQWSSRPIQADYLITVEDITELMTSLKQKEMERDELERQQMVMGTQSSIEHEIERVQYRLELLARVEASTSDGRKALRQTIEQLSGPVSLKDITVVKLWSRYIKRRSLICVSTDEIFPINWISLTIQELLDLGFGRTFSIFIDPETQLDSNQLLTIQDLIIESCLKLYGRQVEVLVSLRPDFSDAVMTLLFRSSQDNGWLGHVYDIFSDYSIEDDDNSATVQVVLRPDHEH